MLWEQKIIVLHGIDTKDISQKTSSENFTERGTEVFSVRLESKKCIQAKSQSFSVYFINEPKLSYFLTSNIWRKQRNVFVFFSVASMWFFSFFSIVFPQIMLVFFLKIVWSKFLTFKNSFNWFIKESCCEHNSNHFFLLCFSNKLFPAANKYFCCTNKKKRVHLEYMFGLPMEIRPLVAWRCSSDIGVSKGSSTRGSFQG